MVERLELLQQRYTDLTLLMSDPEIAADYEKVAEYAKERAELQDIVDLYHQYQSNSNALEATQDMLSDEDLDIREMAREEISQLEAEIDAQAQRLAKMLVPKDPRDEKNVIVEIRAGAGGDEAGLFAAELLRLYTRYAERQLKWQVELISENHTGIGGYKEVVFTIQGKGAYSRLKYESGVHRVQRVPVTESSGRIHTSTVTVAVLPEVDDVEINIHLRDLEISTYGASGPGGQHMQKNETAVRIIHIPTGTAVTCESERSLTQNKNRAMSVLRARLYEEELNRQTSEIDADRKAQVGSAERSEKIRTYNYPQNRVTDHRIGMNSYNLPAVMEGDIDDFIEALILDEETRRLEAL
ncbi:MAG: peptide chain release factor 1 [Anaerolineae bacterium]|nr:peptide chain release factor 1 [Anaerolineae bacterium]